MKQLIRGLRALGERVNQATININDGGCCVYAAIVAPYINRITPVRIRVAGGWCEERMDEMPNLDEVRECISDPTYMDSWCDENIRFGHVFVEFSDSKTGVVYHHDTNTTSKARNVDPSFNFPVYPGELSMREAEAFASEPYGWNDMFDRRQIPRISKIVRDFFRANSFIIAR